jgi:hypothetical protein
MGNGRAIWRTVIAAVLFVLCIVFVRVVADANRAAKHSAIGSLEQEINDQLAAIPTGGSYPASLAELKLTYPDGGDATLLDHFEYTSTGDRCGYRVTVFDREVRRSFPAAE